MTRLAQKPPRLRLIEDERLSTDLKRFVHEPGNKGVKMKTSGDKELILGAKPLANKSCQSY